MTRGLLYWLKALLILSTLESHCLFSAATLFSDKDPSLLQEVVYVLVNSSSFKQDKTYKIIEHSKDIAFLPHSPVPPSDGIQGILYLQNDSCVENRGLSVSNAPQNVTYIKHIALLYLNGCTAEWKINRAQFDLAVGAVIYDAKPIDVEYLELDTSVSIPVAIVSKDVGEQLYHDLVEIASETISISTTSHWKKYINLTIIPYRKFQPGVWELTIIIGSILVVSSFFIFVIVRYRKHYLQRNLSYNNDVKKEETSVLEENHLDDFPIRSWHCSDGLNYNLDQHAAGRVGIPSSQRMISKLQPENRNALEYNSDDVCYFTANSVIQHSNTSPIQHSHLYSFGDKSIQPVCTICLDDFCNGDQVRRLPCNHDFHAKCVDPWLTTKSKRCPLCKVEVYPRQSPNMILSSSPQRQRHLSNWLPFICCSH